jgi:16S rRNA processing protein RimM
VTQRFAVALVGGPFGIQGYVKVQSLSGEYEHLSRLSSVALRLKGEETIWEIEKVRKIHQRLAIKFRGIDDPEAAKALAGAEIIADRNQAAPLGKDEFYVEDLLGLAVVSEAGEILGHISGIAEGGGGSLAEIRLSSDGTVKFAPFRNEFFGDIRLEIGQAVLLHPWVLE